MDNARAGAVLLGVYSGKALCLACAFEDFDIGHDVSSLSADVVVEVRWELLLLPDLCLYFTYFPLLPHIGWSMRGRSIHHPASPFCFL